MLWTCPCCDYDRVSWRPKTWTEAEVGAIARACCEGRRTTALRGARGFVFLGDRFAADAQIRCPRCRQKFYPGDTLDRRLSRSKSTPKATSRPALPAR